MAISILLHLIFALRTTKKTAQVASTFSSGLSITSLDPAYIPRQPSSREVEVRLTKFNRDLTTKSFAYMRRRKRNNWLFKVPDLGRGGWMYLVDGGGSSSVYIHETAFERSARRDGRLLDYFLSLRRLLRKKVKATFELFHY